MKINDLIPTFWNKNRSEVEGLSVLKRLMNDSTPVFCGFVSSDAPMAGITVCFEGHVRNVTPDALCVASEDSARFTVGLFRSQVHGWRSKGDSGPFT